MKFKSKLCVGCQVCTVVCSLHYYNEINLELGKIKIERMYPKLEDPIFKSYYCRHCKNAKCIEVCEPGALRYAADGVEVLLEEALCNGCGACVIACPFSAIWVNEQSSKAIKCNLCNGDPMCVKYCPHGALSHKV
jgi:Fe-S-cluster-containing dehydrogenase component